MQFTLSHLAQIHFRDPQDPRCPNFTLTPHIPVSVEEFLSYLREASLHDPSVQWKLGEYHAESDGMLAREIVYIDGHAPFCTHLIVANPWKSILNPLVPITKENRHLLCSGYLGASRRTPLGDHGHPWGVLEQWFDRTDVTPEPAAWLDVALLPCQHLRSNAAQDGWGVVEIRTSPIPGAVPPTPAEVALEALHWNEPLSPEVYAASVAFWSKHALVRGWSRSPRLEVSHPPVRSGRGLDTVTQPG